MSNTLPAVQGSRSFRYAARPFAMKSATIGSVRLKPQPMPEPQHDILAFTDGDVRQTQTWCSDRLEHGNIRKAFEGLNKRLKTNSITQPDGSTLLPAVFSIAVPLNSKYGYAAQGHIPALSVLLYSRIWTPDQYNAICDFSDISVLDVIQYTGFTMALLSADSQKLSQRVVDDY